MNSIPCILELTVNENQTKQNSLLQKQVSRAHLCLSEVPSEMVKNILPVVCQK